MILNIKKYKEVYIISGVLLFFAIIAFICNRLTGDYFVAQGDFYQGIFLNKNISSYLFTWFKLSGQGQFNPLVVTFPYYLFQLLLHEVGLNYGLIANILMFIFLGFSFLSFFFSIKIFRKYFNFDKNLYAEISAAVFYSLNVFTFQTLTYSFSYLHHFMIYMFLPLLMVFPLKIFSQPRLKNYFYFSLLFIILLPVFNNIAFLFILLFFQVILYLLLVLFKFKINLKTVFFVICLELLLSSIILLPFFSSQIKFANELQTTQSFGGDSLNIVRATSNSLLDIFSSETQEYHFPAINLFDGLPLKEYLPLLLFLPYLLIIIPLFKIGKSNKEYLKVVNVFFILFLGTVILAARIFYPFEAISSIFFKLPGALLFRSQDKSFIFLQFFLTILVFISLTLVNRKKLKIFLVLAFLLSTYMFYTGGIVNYLSQGYEANLIKPKTDGYKLLVNIPDEYMKLPSIIDSDRKNQSIVSLPYSVVNSLNWSNYPKWNFIGRDILFLLFDKTYISANTYDHPTKETTLSFYDFEQEKLPPSKILEIIKQFGGQYIIYHKDIEPSWLEDSKHVRESLQDLASRGLLIKLESNSYFILYKLPDDILEPLIKLDGGSLTFRKISPVKYELLLHVTKNSKLIFLQSFNSQWKLFSQENNLIASDCGDKFLYKRSAVSECYGSGSIFTLSDLGRLWGTKFDDDHFFEGTYANSWNINKDEISNNFSDSQKTMNPDGSVDIQLTLYFVSQTYLYYGILVIILILFVFLLKSISLFLRNKSS